MKNAGENAYSTKICERLPDLRSRLLDCSLIFSLLLTARAFAAGPLTMEQRLSALRKSPSELYAFLYKMPKGADLHNHLAGAVYAENFLEAAIEQHLCVDKTALALVQCGPGRVDAPTIRTDNALRNALIDSLSMRNFVPGKQSAEDHFF